MTKKNGKYFLPGLSVILALIVADQYTKGLIIAHLGEQARTIVLTPFLNLVMVWNKGVSFGLLDTELELARYGLIALALAASAFMLFWLRRAEDKSTALALSLISGGALANVIDRVRLGAVADFIDVHYQDLHWPAFNVADAGITLGAAILMLLTFKGKTS